MKIPKSFSLGGVDWTVNEASPLPGLCGVCMVDEGKVHIDSTLPPQIKEQTFCHELVHCILSSMGKTNHDEEFVDGFGTFLHQFLKTAK